MNTLPKWIFANPFPAIHDFESLTVLEQTARLYGVINELITKYNEAVEKLKEYGCDQIEAREDFELKITKVMNEFMCCMESTFKDNLDKTTKTVIKEMIASGEIAVADPFLEIEYEEATEAITVTVNGGVDVE